jgi:hypothetical protein
MISDVRRKISAGTRSDRGRDCRDAFPWDGQDMHQSRRGILGLSQKSSRCPRSASHPAIANPHPASTEASLKQPNAHGFVGITSSTGNWLVTMVERLP